MLQIGNMPINANKGSCHTSRPRAAILRQNETIEYEEDKNSQAHRRRRGTYSGTTLTRQADVHQVPADQRQPLQ